MFHVTGSLRFRLTLWFMIVFAAVQVALGGALTLFRHDGARRRLDRILETRAAEKAELLARAASAWTNEELRAVAESIQKHLSSEACLIRLRDGDGSVVAAATVGTRLELPVLGRNDGPEARLSWLDVVVGRGDDRRLAEARALTRRVSVGGRVMTLEIVVVPRLAEELIAFVIDFFVIALPIGLVAAAVSGWLIAGRTTAPLEQMAETVEAISPHNLAQRVDVEPDTEEVAGLQERLNDALDRLEEGYKAQERFIANVSHELKTPVAVLLAEAQTLAAGSGDAGANERFRRSVEQEMRHVGKLVESFLTLARSDRSKGLAREVPVTANDIVVDVVQRLDAIAEQHQVGLVPSLALPADDEEPPEILGDPELLQNLLDNLVRNAIQFSPPAESIDIAVTHDRTHVRFAVQDRGPGVTEADRERLFDRYYQGGGGRERGTGLGLAIARSITRLHGGTIEVRNNDDRGCTFEVRLPRLT